MNRTSFSYRLPKDKKRKMRRKVVDQNAIFRRMTCGSLGLLLLWVFVITLVFGLIVHETRKRLNNTLKDIQATQDEFSEIQGCCAEFEAVRTDLEACTPACQQAVNNSQDLLFGRGCWNADTNSPTLVSGSCEIGDEYVTCVSGSTSLDGVQVWEFGNVLKCLNVSGTVRWVKVSAEASGTSGGPFLHTFAYTDTGDSGIDALFTPVIGHYWIHGTRVYIHGRAQGGRTDTTTNVEFQIANLPIPPTSLPSGYMEASTIKSETFISRGRDYASVVSPSAFSTPGNYFNFTLNGKAFSTYDLLFEMSYETV